MRQLSTIALTLFASATIMGCPPPPGGCDDANPCTADSWNGSSCVHNPVAVGTSCNDNNACSTNDQCNSTGTCTGTPLSCNDNNSCTDDSCNTTTGCVHTNSPPTKSCDDGSVCTTADHCSAAGTCVGTAINCDDLNSCTIDSCNASAGCMHASAGTSVLCNDQNACTADDHCNGLGTCIGGGPVNCDDGNVCTLESCEPATGCVYTGAGASTSCSDNNECTSGDHCDGVGACTSGTLKDCADTNPCTLDNCEPATGECVYANAGPGTTCNDGQECTSTDHCDGSGTCVGTPQVGLSCNDSSVCTSNDQCTSAGLCSGTPIDPNDSNPCTADSCDPAQGVKHDPAPAGTPCPDGDPTNGDEFCNDAMVCLPGTSGVPVLERVGGQDPNVKERRLGAGRHPIAAGTQGIAVAFVEPLMFDGSEPRLGVATFSSAGEGKGVSRIADVMLEADPVVAPLGSGGFALAYAALGADGDGLGIALRVVTAAGVIQGNSVVANETTLYSQRAPDLVWEGSRLVVAWEDNGRICQRGFSEQLAPLGPEECDEQEGAADSRVALTVVNGQVALAWRRDGETGSSIEVRFGSSITSLPLNDLPPSEAPALAALDSTHLLVVYTEGCGTQNAAVIDTTGAIVWSGVLDGNRYSPALIDGYLSWREPGDGPNYDELYLQKLVWNGSTLVANPKRTLPATVVLGDQTSPALASVGSAIPAVWEDLRANAPGQSPHGDVLIGVVGKW